MTTNYTRHGRERLDQRSFKVSDPELIRRRGTLIQDRDAEVYLMRDKDIDAEIRVLLNQIRQFKRLRGCKVVFADDQLVTIVRAGSKHKKTLIRCAQ